MSDGDLKCKSSCLWKLICIHNFLVPNTVAILMQRVELIMWLSSVYGLHLSLPITSGHAPGQSVAVIGIIGCTTTKCPIGAQLNLGHGNKGPANGTNARESICPWPPHAKPSPFWESSCFCLSVAPVITFICTKAGEINSQSLVLPKWNDWYTWSDWLGVLLQWLIVYINKWTVMGVL